jgi:hypothetical protein
MRVLLAGATGAIGHSRGIESLTGNKLRRASSPTTEPLQLRSAAVRPGRPAPTGAAIEALEGTPKAGRGGETTKSELDPKSQIQPTQVDYLEETHVSLAQPSKPGAIPGLGTYESEEDE